MLNRQIIPESEKRVSSHLQPAILRLRAYSIQRLFVIAALVLTLVLVIAALMVKLGASGDVSIAPAVDSFTQFDSLLPGQPRDLLYTYEAAANQRRVNGQPVTEASASVVPETGPFHLIHFTYDERRIESATFYTQTLCVCELYQRWGDPDEITRQRGGEAYRLWWDEGSYQITAVLTPLPSDSGVRVVTLSISG